MEGADRTLTIIKKLRSADRVTVADLAAETGSSEMTIRRDLDLLAEQGVLRRVRGGAVSLLLRGEAPPFAVRQREAMETKVRLAAAVDALLAEGESIILDSGTTTLQVARTLAHRRITVVPLDLHSANALSNSPDVTLLMPGGQAIPGALSFTGHLAEKSLRSLCVDTTVLGVCGLSAEHGITAHYLVEVPTKQAAIAAAGRTIAVCDSSKLGRTSLGLVCPITGIDLLITDTDAPPDAIARIEAAGVTVRLV